MSQTFFVLLIRFDILKETFFHTKNRGASGLVQKEIFFYGLSKIVSKSGNQNSKSYICSIICATNIYCRNRWRISSMDF